MKFKKYLALLLAGILIFSLAACGKDNGTQDNNNHNTAADDQQGGTFTLTNMGIFPVDNFNPILPAPQSCIIGFGRCVEKPAVYQGQICIRTMMVLSVTYDHRVFDGGEVGSIMKTMKEYLETPELFLVQ